MVREGDERGVVMVEYLKVLLFATLGVAAAAAGLGRMLLRYFDVIDTLIALPFP